ncbi:unnamed protein product [Blepharisma stoltei]|uniref:Uncharacterized protein n=1 Tax=Blepharisma stoltei TaxID=1481888 RepID=A0AAU9ITU1_9CILI|nr:unnamed protein product [Blepharisma stoltei]
MHLHHIEKCCFQIHHLLAHTRLLSKVNNFSADSLGFQFQLPPKLNKNPMHNFYSNFKVAELFLFHFLHSHVFHTAKDHF